METLKNFIIGIAVLLMGMVILLVTFMTWPFLAGITSVVLFITAAVLFLILIFYVVVLVGHLTRMLLSAMKKDF